MGVEWFEEGPTAAGTAGGEVIEWRSAAGEPPPAIRGPAAAVPAVAGPERSRRNRRAWLRERPGSVPGKQR